MRISRLLILRELRLDAVIRDIPLRRGLNILWARPMGGEARLGEGRLSGHTAGKTTFCRLIRYVLGEERFAAPRVQERVRTGDLRDGWVVAEVIVDGLPWIVGRPFALHLHPFAVRGVTMEEAISRRGSYQDFRDAVTAATTDKLHVARLPSSAAPIDWPLLLTWLTRDQEARFSGVEDWRSSRSESTSPNPPAADRGAVLRAVLGLLSDSEAHLQRRWAELDRSKEEIERKAQSAAVIAADRRRRLARELGLSDGASPGADLFDPAAKKLEDRRAAQASAEAHLAVAEAAAAEAEKARDAAARERDELSGQLKLLARGKALRSTVAKIWGAPDKAESLAPAAPGRCNVPITIARERGCPIAEEAPSLVAATSLVRAPANENDSPAPPGALEPHEAPEHDPAPDSGASRFAKAHAEAERLAEERHQAFARARAALEEARARSAEAQAAARETEKLLAELRAAEKEAEDVARETALRASRMETVSEQRSAMRRAHAEARERLSRRFESILRAMLGDQMGGEVLLTRDGVEPIVKERGDRESAAMDTVKVIAFDLTALSLGFEGHGHFPGFLLHDGPREADMDQAIYDRLFLYARQMEDAFPAPESIGFQYIVTTTTPPPASLRKAPWLIDPVLDASTPEGRLLRMDL